MGANEFCDLFARLFGSACHLHSAHYRLGVLKEDAEGDERDDGSVTQWGVSSLH